MALHPKLHVAKPFLLALCFKLAWLHASESNSHDVRNIMIVDNDFVSKSIEVGLENRDASTAIMKPANFSGPNHFMHLYGKCYAGIFSKYLYSFCPFFNVTQQDRSALWNPFHGILGIWTEWIIDNNILKGMLMTHGDLCSNTHRKTKVHLLCHISNKIINVNESFPCHYDLIFGTPLVCNEASMKVYPLLDETSKKEWDIAETDLRLRFLYPEGYRRKLKKLYEHAGLLLTKSTISKLLATSTSKSSSNLFKSLAQCQTQNDELLRQIETLKDKLK